MFLTAKLSLQPSFCFSETASHVADDLAPVLCLCFPSPDVAGMFRQVWFEPQSFVRARLVLLPGKPPSQPRVLFF